GLRLSAAGAEQDLPGGLRRGGRSRVRTDRRLAVDQRGPERRRPTPRLRGVGPGGGRGPVDRGEPRGVAAVDPRGLGEAVRSASCSPRTASAGNRTGGVSARNGGGD